MKRRLYTTPSPSALQLKELCFARAVKRYSSGEREEQGDKAALGERCHVIAQRYLVHGTAPSSTEERKIYSDWAGKKLSYYPGRIVSRMLKHLPPAGSVSKKRIERHLELEYRGIKFNGKIDFEPTDGVTDFKFTTSLDYAKTRKQLKTDAQRVIYSMDRFERRDEISHYTRWILTTFDAKRTKLIEILSKRKQTVRLMDRVIVPEAESLLRALSDGVDWTSLPKNFDACSKFPPNGCPYRKECKASDTAKQKKQRFIASVEQLRQVRS